MAWHGSGPGWRDLPGTAWAQTSQAPASPAPAAARAARLGPITESEGPGPSCSSGWRWGFLLDAVSGGGGSLASRTLALSSSDPTFCPQLNTSSAGSPRLPATVLERWQHLGLLSAALVGFLRNSLRQVWLLGSSVFSGPCSGVAAPGLVRHGRGQGRESVRLGSGSMRRPPDASEPGGHSCVHVPLGQ